MQVIMHTQSQLTFLIMLLANKQIRLNQNRNQKEIHLLQQFQLLSPIPEESFRCMG